MSAVTETSRPVLISKAARVNQHYSTATLRSRKINDPFIDFSFFLFFFLVLKCQYQQVPITFPHSSGNRVLQRERERECLIICHSERVIECQVFVMAVEEVCEHSQACVFV